MKIKHTPGNWSLDESWDDYTGQRIISQGRVIAYTVTTDAIKESAEEKANARLIAAAPKLLEFCRYFLKTCENELRRIKEDSGTDCPAYENTAQVIVEVKAVIAKATK